MDKMRAEFEEWYEGYCAPAESDWFKRDQGDKNAYFHATTADAWAAWQAALATRSAPAGSGEVVLPNGWVSLTIDFDNGYPEEVAYGPEVMMKRLQKWLEKYHSMLAHPDPDGEAVACWSCKKPVTLEQRSDADGNCPHCGCELDLADWPVKQPAPDARLVDALENLVEFADPANYQSACECDPSVGYQCNGCRTWPEIDAARAALAAAGKE